MNHQGSVMAMSDAAGAVSQRMAYDEYGNLSADSLINGQQFRYTGRRFDPETGLYYYRARYYSPAMGRFLQTDPIGYEDDFNLYAYVGNDPVNKTDPSGLGCGSLIETVDAPNCSSVYFDTPNANQKKAKSKANAGAQTQSGISTTAAERQMLQKNDIAGYYNSREARGDAYALLALDVVNNSGFLGKSANLWMFSTMAFALSDSEKARLLGDGTYIDLIRRINIDLANRHARAVDADTFGVRGLLSANQISQYHESYFQNLGLPGATFGGSFFFGVRTDYWCSGCDSVP